MGIAERRASLRPRQLLRQPGWERRLVTWAESQIGRPFLWGETDCATLAVDAIRAMCGADSIDSRARRYRTRLGALRASHQVGGIRAQLLRFGLREFPIVLAQQGDIVVSHPRGARGLEHAAVVVSGRLLDVGDTDGTPVRWSALRDASTVGAVALRV